MKIVKALGPVYHRSRLFQEGSEFVVEDGYDNRMVVTVKKLTKKEESSVTVGSRVRQPAARKAVVGQPAAAVVAQANETDYTDLGDLGS